MSLKIVKQTPAWPKHYKTVKFNAYFPAKFNNVKQQKMDTTLTLSAIKTLKRTQSAQLPIVADGANSTLCQQLGITLSTA